MYKDTDATHLLEPIGDAAMEIVLFKNWNNDPRSKGLPTRAQIQWKQRDDPDYRNSVLTRYGHTWAVHVPSLKAYLAGKRHVPPTPGDTEAAA